MTDKKYKKAKSIKKAHVFVTKHLKKISFLNKKDQLSQDTQTKQPKFLSEDKKDNSSDNKTELISNHIEEQLFEIYENSDGTMPDMSSIDLKKSSSSNGALFVLFASCIFFAIVVWFGFFNTPSDVRFLQEDVIVSVSGESSIAPGEEVVFRVRYRNTQKVALHDVSVNVRYPEGFVFSKASIVPSNETNDTWEVGSLQKEDGGFIDIYGRIYSDIQSEQSFRVFLNYIPDNFTSQFQKVDHAEFLVDKKLLTLQVKVGSAIISGVKTPISIDTQSNVDLTDIYKQVYVRIDSDGLFTKESSEPKSDTVDQYRWSIDKTKEVNTIVVSGVFSSVNDQSNNLRVLLYGQPATGTADVVLLDTFEIPIAISQTDVSAQLIVNGTSGSLTMQPGEKMITSFVVKNNGDQAVSDVQLRLRVDAPSVQNQSIMKWSDVVDIADGTIVGEQLDKNTRRGVITWTSSQISALGKLLPGQQVIVDIELPIKDNQDIDLASFELFNMALIGQVQYTVASDRKTIGSNPIDVIIQSDLDFSSDADSSGNIYDITWILTNTFHELKNIVISTEFFGDVSIDQKSLDTPPAGSINYDATKQKLVWNIETMPTVVDILAHKLLVTLNKKKAGQTQLSDKIRVEALDSVTGEKILIVLDPMVID